MPGPDGDGQPPRTLAEKLSMLREARAPEGGSAPSWDSLAKQITKETGVSISGAYLWELGTGKPGTNVRLTHLKALAQFFKRRTSYFIDDEAAFEDDAQVQLALLKELHRLGIQDIRLQNVQAEVSTQAVVDILGRLQTLDVLRDASVREVALQVADLTPKRREAIRDLLGRTSLLDSIPRLMGLIEAAAELTDEQIASATDAAERPDALQAIQSKDALEFARQYGGLLPSSRELVRSTIRQLEGLERGSA